MKDLKSLWIFCHYAQQPPFNTMLRYHNWGKHLKNKGYMVTIVAASTVHNTEIDVIEKCNGSIEQNIDGVRYLYVSTPKYSGNGFKRIRNMISYSLGLSKFKKYDFQPDITLFCGAYLYPFIRRGYKKLPMICDIVDLWPLSIIEYTSISKYNPFIKMLFTIEKIAYMGSSAIIFSMEGGIDYIKESKYSNKIHYDHVFHLNMGSDLVVFDEIKSSIDEENFNSENFLITYCGSMRQANHVIKICEAAKILKEKGFNQIIIRFYGNGPEEESAKIYCQENQLNNVRFFGRFQKEDLSTILSNSDVNIMTYMTSKVMKYGGSQSKLFDYLSSGKPIINSGDWGYNLVSRYNCGVVISEQTSENIAFAIQRLYQLSEDELKVMGGNARHVAEMYDQPILVEQLCEILNTILLR
jgi:glycosyltransferase involved in cell wall biosynthesis